MLICLLGNLYIPPYLICKHFYRFLLFLLQILYHESACETSVFEAFTFIQFTLFTTEVRQYDTGLIKELLNNSIAHMDFSSGAGFISMSLRIL